MPNQQIYDTVFRDYFYNLAPGMNLYLKERCPYLEQYSSFSNRLNENRQSGMGLNDAVRETLSYCGKHGIMQDYLPYKEKEVLTMLNYAWNEEEARDSLIEYGSELGIQQGIQQEQALHEQQEQQRVLDICCVTR